MQTQNPKFVKGIYFNFPRQGAPDYILGRLSISLKDFVQYLRDNEIYLKEMEVMNKNGKAYLNIDIKRGNSGPYLQVNEWKPKNEEQQSERVMASSMVQGASMNKYAQN